MRVAVVAALLLVSASPAARAAESADAMATDLARMMMPQSTYEQLVSTMDAQMRQTMAPMIQKLAPDVDPEELVPVFADELAAMVRTLMPSYDEMSALQAKILAKHYTVAELKELRAFYRSPLGQKSIRITPEVMKDVTSWVQSSLTERMPAAMQEFQQAVEPKIREYVRTKGKK